MADSARSTHIELSWKVDNTALKEANQETDKIIDKAKKADDKYAKTGETVKKTTTKVEAHNKEVNEGVKDYSNLGDSAKDSFSTAQKSADKTTSAINNQTDAVEDSAKATKDFGDTSQKTHQNVKRDAESAKNVIEQKNNSIDDSADAVRNFGDESQKANQKSKASTESAKQEFENLGGAISAMAEQAGNDITAGIQKPLSGAKDIIMGIGATAGLVGVGGMFNSGMDRLSSIENSRLSLDVMLGDSAKAGVFMDDLLDFARTTPYAFQDLAESGKNLIAFGMDVEEVIPTIASISEVAAASGQGGAAISSLTDTFGRMQVAGRMTSNDLRSFNAKGVNALAILANEAGVHAETMRDMISAGEVSADFANDALVRGIQNGTSGLAGDTVAMGGIMESLNDTWTGSVDSLKSSISRTMATIIEPIKPHIQSGMKWIGNQFEKLPDMLVSAKQSLKPVVEAVAPVFEGAKDFIFNDFLPGIGSAARIMGPGFMEGGIAAFRTLGWILENAVYPAFRAVSGFIEDNPDQMQKVAKYAGYALTSLMAFKVVDGIFGGITAKVQLLSGALKLLGVGKAAGAKGAVAGTAGAVGAKGAVAGTAGAVGAKGAVAGTAGAVGAKGAGGVALKAAGGLGLGVVGANALGYFTADEEDKDERAGALVGSAVGVKGGAVLGAKIGTLIAPGIGTAIGTAVGGLGGALAGSKFGAAFGKNFESFMEAEGGGIIERGTRSLIKGAGEVAESARELFTDPLSSEIKPEDGVTEKSASAVNDYMEMQKSISGTRKLSSITGEAMGASGRDDILSIYDDMASLQHTRIHEMYDESAKDMGRLVELGVIGTDRYNDFHESAKENIAEREKQIDEFNARAHELTERFYKDELKITQKYEDQIEEIRAKARDENRTLTAVELDEISDLEKSARDDRIELHDDYAQETRKLETEMRESAVGNLTESEEEQMIILGRLKNDAGEISAEQAAELVKNSVSARDGAIEAANETFDETVAALERQHYVTGELSAEEFAEAMALAEQKRDDSVATAEEMHKGVVAAAQAQAEGYLNKINWQTGESLSVWDRFKFSLADSVNWVSTQLNKILSFFGIPNVPMFDTSGSYGSSHSNAPVDTQTAYMMGMHYGGADSASGQVLVGEEGFEVAYHKESATAQILGANGPQITNVPTGTRILNHQDSVKLLTGGLGADKVLPGFSKGTGGVGDFIKDAGNRASDAASNAGNWVGDKASNVGGAISSAWDWASDIGKEAKKWVTDPIGQTTALIAKHNNFATEGVEGIGYGAMTTLGEGAKGTIPNMLSPFKASAEEANASTSAAESQIRKYARGGRPPTGEVVLVGEEGPELFHTDTPGQISSHEKTKQLLNGNQQPNITINFEPKIDITIQGNGVEEEIKKAVDEGIKRAMDDFFKKWNLLYNAEGAM